MSEQSFDELADEEREAGSASTLPPPPPRDGEMEQSVGGAVKRTADVETPRNAPDDQGVEKNEAPESTQRSNLTVQMPDAEQMDE